jgi:hypothetical protein
MSHVFTFVCREVMVFNTTFNNISVILWRSVLLVEETGVPREDHRPITDKLYHIMLYGVHLIWAELTLVVIGTDYIGVVFFVLLLDFGTLQTVWYIFVCFPFYLEYVKSQGFCFLQS